MIRPRVMESQSSSDRVLACVAHLVTFVAPVIAPLAMFAATTHSPRFVRLHVACSLIEAITTKLLLFLVIVASLVHTFGQLSGLADGKPTEEVLMAAVIKLALVWLIVGSIALYDLVKTILLARRAYLGHEPTGWSVRLANRWLS